MAATYKASMSSTDRTCSESTISLIVAISLSDLSSTSVASFCPLRDHLPAVIELMAEDRWPTKIRLVGPPWPGVVTMAP